MKLETKSPDSSASKRQLYFETIGYFLKLGAIGFGGPVALVAMIQRDLIEERNWMEKDRFLQVLAMIKAMPGALAFQVAVTIGRHRVGWWCGLACGVALLTPAFLMMLVLGMFYSEMTAVPLIQAALLGMQMSALGLVFAASKSLVMPYRKSAHFWMILIASLGLTRLQPSLEPLYIIVGGVISILARRQLSFLFLPWVLWGGVAFAQEATVVNPFSRLPEMCWVLVRAGATVFGSGLAIVPLLEGDFVQRLHWLTHQEFMSALAFGQITPGPVLITAAFIGFKIAGFWGACLATASVYGPGAFHMLTWFPRFVDRMAKTTWINPFIEGAIAAVAGAILASSWKLFTAEPVHAWQAILLFGTLIVCLFSKLPSWAVIPFGGLVGILIQALEPLLHR